jgi:phage tail-like protein
MPGVVVGSPLQYFQKFAFVVQIDGVSVGGFNKAGPIKQTWGIAEQHEGGALTVVDVSVTKYKTEKLTLERGGSNNNELWLWHANQKQGIVDKRNVSVVAQDSQANTLARYNYTLCVIGEFEAGDFDGKNETENIIEKLVLVPVDMNKVVGGP